MSQLELRTEIPGQGALLRDEGIQRVSEPEERQAWLRKALAAIERAPAGEEFTAEDVRTLVGDPPHPNLMGSAIRQACLRDLIIYAGSELATRSSRHASRLPVWRRL